MPEKLEAHTFYGQVLKFVELTLPVDSITSGNSPETEHNPLQIILLAVIETVKLVAKNQLGIPYYRCNETRAIEVIDVSCIDCVVGRVKERGKWAIIERPKSLVELDVGRGLIDNFEHDADT